MVLCVKDRRKNNIREGWTLKTKQGKPFELKLMVNRN
jgi:hypothetical protein